MTAHDFSGKFEKSWRPFFRWSEVDLIYLGVWNRLLSVSRALGVVVSRMESKATVLLMLLAVVLVAGARWLVPATKVSEVLAVPRMPDLLIAACAVAAGIAMFHTIKRRVCRIRPRDIEPHCWAHIVTRDRFSFPSGHSTTAFAVAVSLGSFYPEIMPLLLVLAANVAISRVVVGMHFLSDVLVGSGVGALLGYVAFRFAV